MATVTVKGNETTTSGDLPPVGEQLPAFELLGHDLSPITGADFSGKQLVLNIFPSLDTGVCAQSVRTFNKLAAGLDNTAVLCVSEDLPFAQQRFCAAEGIDNVTAASAFRSSFGEDFGVRLEGTPMKGLLARAVVVTDAAHNVIYTELVSEIGNEPDYDAAQAALKA
ncbi:thiol peroxidase [Corynebacterium liangguodongii]|uniref:Thiol peroxidase n=1 Tax=Corynebacterium liangguodongii TaxID=2079535 RepID=A0A2S0WH30_9CORY|nr:thiol peroxidase [Corynebacterium liangguodongii]AWB85081.1 thiol peroxidase [Corynebacterium liangguodongii]PWC00318.1 thiol peroxidase [Corynebacterium liangguodongii]